MESSEDIVQTIDEMIDDEINRASKRIPLLFLIVISILFAVYFSYEPLDDVNKVTIFLLVSVALGSLIGLFIVEI